MMMTASNGGIGVTFFSQYPHRDAYYRLRRHGSTSFHISPHGTEVFGVTDTRVIPVPNVWYWFRIWVQDTGVRTEILAKVWQEGQAEPADWQVNAYDDTPSRLVSGTFGVWSYSSGNKYWDDLTVVVPDPLQDDLTLWIETLGNGIVLLEPERSVYSFGESVTLSAVADPGWMFMGWGGDLGTTKNPVTIVMKSNLQVVAYFSDSQSLYSESFEGYPAGEGPG
jgi:hypothetical protein